MGALGFVAFQFMIRNTVIRVEEDVQCNEDQPKFNVFKAMGNFVKNRPAVGATVAAMGMFVGMQGAATAVTVMFQSYFKNVGISGLVSMFSMIPIVVFTPLARKMVVKYGKKELSIVGAIASIIGGLFEGVLGFFLKPLRRFFPSVVTGTVVTAIGLSLISVGINSFGGGNNNKDFGSPTNLLIGLAVLIFIIVLKHFTKGIWSAASILFGIIFGYILCAILAMFLDTTYVVEGETYVHSWVLQWDKVAAAAWISLPKIMPVKFVFDARAIIPIMIMFVVTAVETIGDLSGITEGGLGREATDKELSGGVACDGIGSTFATLFGVLPNTSFSQNVGLVGMTKIINLYAISMGAIFLVLCGFIPKLAAIIQLMPQSVLGGAAVFMFASIVVSGIQLITKDGISNREVTIVAVSLGLGYGLGATANVLAMMPSWVGYIFGGSGIVPAAVCAIILNIVLKKDENAKQVEPLWD
jgi:uracil-xanthine permease